MGPRFNGVEDLSDPTTIKQRNHRLQWGHALMAWKTSQYWDDPTNLRMLQWGHALMAWKTSVTDAGVQQAILLQWGHALMAWKTARNPSRESAGGWEGVCERSR